jgi:hypothetical protein
MRKYILSTAGILLVVISTFAQEVDLKDLKTPNSPGFQLLDIAPSNIERPTNPKALAVNIFSLTNSGTAIPKNFSFEMSPYWYLKNPNASIYKYLNIAPDGQAGKQNYFSGILNKLSVSAISSFSDSTRGSMLKNTNYISVGARTNLFTFRTTAQSQKMKLTIAAIGKKFRELTPELNKSKLDLLIATQKAKRDTQRLGLQIDQAEKSLTEARQNHTDTLVWLEKIAKYQDELDQTIAKVAKGLIDRDQLDSNKNVRLEKAIKEDKKTQELLTDLNEPPLIQIDAAWARSWAFPGNAFEGKRFNREAVWLNGTFAFSTNKPTNVVSLTVSSRWMNDNLLADTTKNIFVNKSCFDWGGKFEYATGSFSFSFEYINRTYGNIKLAGNERSIGMIQYKLSDGVYMVGSFGKNFGTGGNLFTLFGINWNFGKTAMSEQGFK